MKSTPARRARSVERMDRVYGPLEGGFEFGYGFLLLVLLVILESLLTAASISEALSGRGSAALSCIVGAALLPAVVAAAVRFWREPRFKDDREISAADYDWVDTVCRTWPDMRELVGHLADAEGRLSERAFATLWLEARRRAIGD